jgi:CRP-like cAMP-binding protein
MQIQQNRILKIKTTAHTDCSACSIRKIALFQGVPKDQLEWTQHYRENQYTIHAGRVLFHQGGYTHHVYTVFEGWFALYQVTNAGKRQIMRFALPGDFIGFQVDSHGKTTHAALALTDGVLCGFPRQKLTNMMETQPKISESLIIIVSRDMGLCQQHFFGMTQKTAIESISFLLLELYHRIQRKQYYQEGNQKSNTIPFPLTQEDIGDATGVSKIHTNRVLRQLKNQGIIEYQQKTLTILNEVALNEISQFDISCINNPKVI